MLDALRCPSCGTIADSDPLFDPGNRCKRCGTILAPAASDWNPYEPPSSSLKSPVDEFPVPLEIPRSIFGKFSLAFWLLGTNLVLFSLIIWTVWIPANLVIESLEAAALPGQEGQATMRANLFVKTIFGPIAMGALVFALSRRIHGEPVNYFQAIGAGFANWGRLFIANFIAGLIVGLATIALIVPGIIMQVRYALLDPVVVLERSEAPRARSTQLTAGRRWQIFWAYFLFLAFYLPLALVVSVLASSLESPEQYWINVAVGSVLDVISTIGSIVLFLFYCEARQIDDSMHMKERDGEEIIKRRMSEFLE
jgi:hypothetical protein